MSPKEQKEGFFYLFKFQNENYSKVPNLAEFGNNGRRQFLRSFPFVLVFI